VNNANGFPPSDDASEIVDLVLNCVYCGGSSDVHCENWQSDAPLVPAPFECPYCRKQNAPRPPARLTRVRGRGRSEPVCRTGTIRHLQQSWLPM
jgi:hypothetical protein